MCELYCEKYYDNEELQFLRDAYSISLSKDIVNSANEFFREFYKKEKNYCKIHDYEGFALDVFPTDASESMEELAKKYTGCELPKEITVRTDMTFDEFLSHVEPNFCAEDRAELILTFKRLFGIELDEEPVSVLETGCFDSVHSYQFYILCGLWIARFKNFTLLITLGSDE